MDFTLLDDPNKIKCYYPLQRNYVLFLQFLSCKWMAPILLDDLLHTFHCNYISPETGVLVQFS